ncbi:MULTISPECIES: histidine kinase [Streptomyces]|uniref:Signal transduction histidine kinase subgroup 3 dimerisation and phosphoacceptor domain-containing protein n=2 Tax=Streptomyces TaxID=1883 RepID=A0A117IVN4_9ACTN|nr:MULTISPECIES: histidine kinase [Streptomyces]KUH37851.1 hypothetical protein ATE80_16060 [Streptomyces kanasensis]UUS31866.1 histidine kinase [Streptomyces changanensis]
MPGLTGWWSRRSNPEKVELYTRWTYHGLAGVSVLISGLPALALAVQAGPIGGWLFLLVVVHTVLVAVLASWALSWQLGRRDRPHRLMAAVAALTVLGCVTVLAQRRVAPLLDLQITMYIAAGLVSWGVGALALCSLRARHLLALTVVAIGGVAGLALAMGLPATAVVGVTLSSAFGTVVFAVTSGFSGWLLRAVWELDAAHRLQARLAVTEERLRFARDLHDVMGRNLSVIALKSELAVQLARRGATDRAVTEMAEVQRIAQDSQREVRDVVRGYRGADLHTELEGARGVLAAAGIVCRVDARDAEAVVPAPVQSALAWVVREATTNVLRHGDARLCEVTVTVPAGSDRAVLVIENDGAAATAVPAVPGAVGGAGAADGPGAAGDWPGTLVGPGLWGVAGAGGGAGGPGGGGAPGCSGPSGVPGAGGGTGVPGGSGAGAGGGTGAGRTRAPEAPGSGLAGLRERLAALDGVLEAGPVDGGNRFRVTARVPLGAATGAAAAAVIAGTGVAGITGAWTAAGTTAGPLTRATASGAADVTGATGTTGATAATDMARVPGAAPVADGVPPGRRDDVEGVR